MGLTPTVRMDRVTQWMVRTLCLDIYWVDVEGGAATLVVSPSGESLLFDAGWEERDAKRIADVAHQTCAETSARP